MLNRIKVITLVKSLLDTLYIVFIEIKSSWIWLWERFKCLSKFWQKGNVNMDPREWLKIGNCNVYALWVKYTLRKTHFFKNHSVYLLYKPLFLSGLNVYLFLLFCYYRYYCYLFYKIHGSRKLEGISPRKRCLNFFCYPIACFSI